MTLALVDDPAADTRMRRAFLERRLELYAVNRDWLRALPRYFWPAVSPEMQRREAKFSQIRQRTTEAEKLHAWRRFER